jgi:MFS family permease
MTTTTTVSSLSSWTTTTTTPPPPPPTTTTTPPDEDPNPNDDNNNNTHPHHPHHPLGDTARSLVVETTTTLPSELPPPLPTLEGNDDDHPGDTLVILTTTTTTDHNKFKSQDDNNNSNNNSSNTKSRTMRRINQRRRKGLFICAVLYTLLFVGAFFGWGPMQLLLEENGAFASKCPPPPPTIDTVPMTDERTNNNTTVRLLQQDDDDDADTTIRTCPAQKAALLNVHFIATVTQIDSPILGHLADKFGSRRMAYGMILCMGTGLSLLVLATAYSMDTLLFVSFLCLAHGTWIGGLLTVQTGMYFRQEQTRNRVIFILNSVFDAGGVIFWILWWIGQQVTATVTQLVSGFLGVAVLVLGTSLYFWTVAIPARDEDDDDDEEEEEVLIESLLSLKNENELNHDSAAKGKSKNMMLQTLPSGLTDPISNNQSTTMITTHPEKVEDGLGSSPTMQNDSKEEKDPAPDPTSEDETKYILVADRSALRQLTSGPALMIAIFFTIHATSNQFVLTTTRDYLAYLGDDQVGNRYLSIFTLLTPASLLALPLVDAILTRFGLHGGLQTINFLALTYLFIRVIDTQLDGWQVFGFLIFSCYRCFLFGVTLSSLPTLLGPTVVGKATGLLYMVTGIMSIFNIPLSNITIQHLEGNFFFPHVFFLILILPCIGAAWGVGRAVQREQTAKQERDDAPPQNQKLMKEEEDDYKSMDEVSA